MAIPLPVPCLFLHMDQLEQPGKESAAFPVYPPRKAPWEAQPPPPLRALCSGRGGWQAALPQRPLPGLSLRTALLQMAGTCFPNKTMFLSAHWREGGCYTGEISQKTTLPNLLTRVSKISFILIYFSQ